MDEGGLLGDDVTARHLDCELKGGGSETEPVGLLLFQMVPPALRRFPKYLGHP